MKWTETYQKRYWMYRRNHGVFISWINANDPFWFMIVYPAITGTLVGWWIIK